MNIAESMMKKDQSLCKNYEHKEENDGKTQREILHCSLTSVYIIHMLLTPPNRVKPHWETLYEVMGRKALRQISRSSCIQSIIVDKYEQDNHKMLNMFNIEI